MPHRDPTIRSRELGEALRQAMQRAGLSGKQTALALGVTPSFVSMLLSGKRATSEADLAAFLGVCRVKGPERERLLALRREQDTPGWFQQHGTRLPRQLVTLIDHENKAVAISDFQPMVVAWPAADRRLRHLARLPRHRHRLTRRASLHSRGPSAKHGLALDPFECQL